MTQDIGASASADRAVVPTASSPQAVSPVPASIPSAMSLEDVFANLDRLAQAEAERDFSTQWILLGVDRHGEAFILDADEGFWRYDLLTEHWACDNGVDFPTGLSAGLYRLNSVVITPDSSGDPTFKGCLEVLSCPASAMSARSGETEGLAPQAASAVPKADAHNTPEAS